MPHLAEQRERVIARIQAAEQTFHRATGNVQLLAVSKTQDAERIRALAMAGQRCFGENYLQEAQEKIQLLADLNLEWHFIGPIQSNKTRQIASLFHWVHSVDRLKVAERLDAQRPAGLPPLNICLEVNSSGEASKSGVPPAEIPQLALAVAALPNLRLRGLMTIPAPLAIGSDETSAHAPFRLLRELFAELAGQGLGMDTLSMGMSDDLEAAIAEGATMVRVGTALFGTRTARCASG